MNRKKSVILVTTLAILLGVTTVAYALVVGGNSSISTGYITVSGTSTTTADQTYDWIYVYNELYRDGTLVNSSTANGNNLKSIKTTSSASNRPGEQTWQIFGDHAGKIGTTYKYASSYSSVNW
ncbi:hypothetical protein [Thermincola ferriacetica]